MKLEGPGRGMGCIERAADWAGVALDPRTHRQLESFGDWLVGEALPGGGVGPGEADYFECRHLADSVTFAYGWADGGEVLDAGSGVGLPGIPLAIIRPNTTFILVDRSGRRCRLARRAVRVLGLENVAVIQSDLRDLEATYPVVVSRAALPPQELLGELRRLLSPGGTAVVGGPAPPVPEVPGYRPVEIPPAILDRPASLLIMAPS